MATPVLYVDHAPALGGAEHSLLALLRHLDRERWEPHLATVEGALAAAARAEGVTVHPVALPRLRRSPRAPLSLSQGARMLARVVRESGASLLHTNSVRATFYGAAVAPLLRIPFLWHMRDFWFSEARPRYPWLDRLVKRLLCASATRVVANSRAVAAHLPCGSKASVVHNGVELSRFDPAMTGEPFRARAGIPRDARVVGMVGRLRPWKGQERFVELAALLSASHPGTHFLLVGGSPLGEAVEYVAFLRERVAALALENYLHFAGHLEDVRPALAAMDIFVHPGDPEPFGLVNIEAMAMGKPVVAFAHGALPEIVNAGETGLLVAPGDTGALARAAAGLLDDPARRVAMGEAARERVRRFFDIRRTVAGIEAVYHELIAAPSSLIGQR